MHTFIYIKAISHQIFEELTSKSPCTDDQNLACLQQKLQRLKWKTQQNVLRNCIWDALYRACLMFICNCKLICRSPQCWAQSQDGWKGRVSPKTSSHDSTGHPSRNHCPCVHHLQPFWTHNTPRYTELVLWLKQVHFFPLKGNYILLQAFFIIQSIHFKPIGFAGFSISAKPMLKQEALCPHCHLGGGSDTDGPQPRQEDTDQQMLRCCCIRGLKYILWGQSGFDL